MSINAAGGNATEYELPIGPTVSNLPRKQAEALVYSEILYAYKTPVAEGGKGFDRTFIKHQGNRVILRIEWENVLSPEEYDKRIRYIQECRWDPRK
jgi:hypothetical protein